MATSSSRSLQSLSLCHHARLQYVHHFRDCSFASNSARVEFDARQSSEAHRSIPTVHSTLDDRHLCFRGLDPTCVSLLRLLSERLRLSNWTSLSVHDSNSSQFDSIHFACDQLLSLLFLGEELSSWTERNVQRADRSLSIDTSPQLFRSESNADRREEEHRHASTDHRKSTVAIRTSNRHEELSVGRAFEKPLVVEFVLCRRLMERSPMTDWCCVSPRMFSELFFFDQKTSSRGTETNIDRTVSRRLLLRNTDVVMSMAREQV